MEARSARRACAHAVSAVNAEKLCTAPAPCAAAAGSSHKPPGAASAAICGRASLRSEDHARQWTVRSLLCGKSSRDRNNSPVQTTATVKMTITQLTEREDELELIFPERQCH